MNNSGWELQAASRVLDKSIPSHQKENLSRLKTETQTGLGGTAVFLNPQGLQSKVL